MGKLFHTSPNKLSYSYSLVMSGCLTHLSCVIYAGDSQLIPRNLKKKKKVLEYIIVNLSLILNHKKAVLYFYAV